MGKFTGGEGKIRQSMDGEVREGRDRQSLEEEHHEGPAGEEPPEAKEGWVNEPGGGRQVR